MNMTQDEFNAFISDWQVIASQLINEDEGKSQPLEVADFLSFISDFEQILKSQEANFSDNILPRFESFFREWQAVPIPVIKPTEKPKITVDPNKVSYFFDAFSDSHQKYRSKGYDINIWDISGIKNDEVKHCQVLKWLLDKDESHGLGDKLFNFFITQFNWQWADIENKTYNIKTEVAYEDDQNDNQTDDNLVKSNNGSNSRVDIQIENDQFFLIMEVKINATETNDQIMRYCRIAKKRCEYNQIQLKKWKIVYLTKDGSKPTNCKECDRLEFEQHLNSDIVCLKWRDIASAINKFNTPQSDINPFMQHLLHQYSQYIYRNF